MTPTKQLNKNCCVLACVESLSIDKAQHISQQQIIDQFPIECQKGKFRKNPDGSDNLTESRDGETAPQAFFQILKTLGFASSFEVGIGKDFIDARTHRINDGIFLFTTTHPDGTPEGYHCVRVENPEPGQCYVMEPSQGYGASYRPLQWNSQEFLKSIVIVCLP